MLPDDIGDWYVRAADGQMVPFSAFSSSRWEYGSPRLERYNGLPSMEILGQAAPGKSTGEAMELMEQLASKLPTGVGYDWTGMSYQERLSGNQAPSLYAISLIVVFLCLAALYELVDSVLRYAGRSAGGYRCVAGCHLPWPDQ